MQREDHGAFGTSSNGVWVNVTEPVNNAQPSGQSVPAQMETGKPYNVSVTMVNNGETTWTRAQQYTLMAQSPHNNTTWGFSRVALPIDNIAPGQSATFNFQVTAPGSAGSYAFQWGMQREGYGSFGPGTTPVMVNVVAPPPLVNNAQVVGMTAPARMVTGEGYHVSVTMRNTGTKTWTPTVPYDLGSQNPGENVIWGPSRLSVATAVAPGQQYTFSFTVKGPAPGTYDMQWRMVEDKVEWFGATAGSPVTVTENLGNVTFIHTDGLGSPVARTDAVGNVISRTRYEPYGYVASGATPTIGFTGHVNDADTGLTYMQQRYYDPVAGRFLSIDPVVTDANTGGSFNRYAYANNSPYKYLDADGRMAKLVVAAIKMAFKGGDAAGSVKGLVDNVKTIADPSASPGSKALAVADIALDLATGVNSRDIEAVSEGATKLYHYTDSNGAKAIEESGKILSNAKGQVFLTPEKLSPSEATNRLWIGDSGTKGSHVVEVNLHPGAVTVPGKNGNEIIPQGTIRDGWQATLKVKVND